FRSRRRRRVRVRVAADRSGSVPRRARSAAALAGCRRAARRNPRARRRAPRPVTLDRGRRRNSALRPTMTFRTRLLAGFGVVVLVPLVVFGLGIRREMSGRLAAEYERREIGR